MSLISKSQCIYLCILKTIFGAYYISIGNALVYSSLCCDPSTSPSTCTYMPLLTVRLPIFAGPVALPRNMHPESFGVLLLSSPSLGPLLVPTTQRYCRSISWGLRETHEPTMQVYGTVVRKSHATNSSQMLAIASTPPSYR